MKLSLVSLFVILMAFQPKPPKFEQKFAAFDQKLYDHAVATGTSGDTAATKTALLLAANDLSGYNVSDELAKIPPAQQGCRWACTGQFYHYCINIAGSTHEAHLCMIEYINCVRTCGYIPF